MGETNNDSNDNDEHLSLNKRLFKMVQEDLVDGRNKGDYDKDGMDPEIISKYDVDNPFELIAMQQEMLDAIKKKKETPWEKTKNILLTVLTFYNWWWILIMISIFILFLCTNLYSIFIKESKKSVIGNVSEFISFSRSMAKYDWIITPIKTIISTVWYYRMFFMK